MAWGEQVNQDTEPEGIPPRCLWARQSPLFPRRCHGGNACCLSWSARLFAETLREGNPDHPWVKSWFSSQEP